MDSKTYKDIAAGTQSFVFSVGLVLAGIWGIYEFYFDKFESLDLQLTASHFQLPDNESNLILAKLKIQNDGNYEVELKLEERCLIANRVEFDKYGKIQKLGNTIGTSYFTFIKGETLINMNRIIVKQNANRSLEFLLPVEELGLYLIELKSYDKKNKGFWSASTYVSVE